MAARGHSPFIRKVTRYLILRSREVTWKKFMNFIFIFRNWLTILIAQPPINDKMILKPSFAIPKLHEILLQDVVSLNGWRPRFLTCIFLRKQLMHPCWKTWNRKAPYYACFLCYDKYWDFASWNCDFESDWATSSLLAWRWIVISIRNLTLRSFGRGSIVIICAGICPFVCLPLNTPHSRHNITKFLDNDVTVDPGSMKRHRIACTGMPQCWDTMVVRSSYPLSRFPILVTRNPHIARDPCFLRFAESESILTCLSYIYIMLADDHQGPFC